MMSWLHRSSWSRRQVERALTTAEVQDKTSWIFRIKMTWIIGLLSAGMVFIAILTASGVGYWVASSSFLHTSEMALEDQTTTLLSDESFVQLLQKDTGEPNRLRTSRLRSPGLYVMVARPRVYTPEHDRIITSGELVSPLETFYGSDDIRLGQPEYDVLYGREVQVARSFDGRLYLSTSTGINGWTLILVQDLAALRSMKNHLAIIFFIVGGFGALLALLAGWGVARTSLVPLKILNEGIDTITRTDNLEPLPVHGTDEVARLTESFNNMISALNNSRVRQSRLVADAGHELKTPLTSLRTNMELLIMASQSPHGGIPPEEIESLQRDVMAQLEELTALVTDLVDLAREDAHEAVLEVLDITELLDGVVDRAERRRSDIHFRYHLIDWFLKGDHRGLSRTFLNLLDNAAKWSPPEGSVSMDMMQIAPHRVRICVDDDGPGIPENERSLVFERFYRSVESRAMPGSGLGLAIVKQVVESHGGTVRACESPSGGTRIEMILPGGATIEDACTS